ncbi:MAG: iron-sulfur cluster assembly scaffold protein [Microbacteriaceae bacterium]
MNAERELLSAIIRDHAAETGYTPLLPAGPARTQLHRISPSCGDALTVQLQLDAGVVTAVRWEGHGCEISRSAASLLAANLTNLPVEAARGLITRYLGAGAGGGITDGDGDAVTDAMLLASAELAPLRRRCARLAWQAAAELLG